MAAQLLVEQSSTTDSKPRDLEVPGDAADVEEVAVGEDKVR